ncbi:DUF305 domain-containing protein [Sinorhizobium medicae]|nr:DUF305 domain-containing protein [Sinorhizobium medicae]MDX0899439.1 DUF305 domain-containing protein [Sinorhizobium medicae]MDX1118207.1 DUF305 domain-containing protein [Sinorhizobium medicae]MDX1217992.1 DUF305 domain-containing protein [Sinorhizobium medicae]MDX1242118.1 DUF305 domain-containing protein [Sinorhizobium medicae]
MSTHYLKYALNLLISLVIMYLVMFTIIDGINDFYNNPNMFYMAIMMVAPMAMLMLLMMAPMYPRKRLNLALHLAFAILFIAAFTFMRMQTFVGDAQFLRSMIHSGAILMCRESSLADPEIAALCERIIDSQKREIAEMNRILARY